ncbi:MAG: orc1/cdc6 family replication initiation protein [Desulfurococcales archaeon]|nr:orc1/cdc6 family replication initiation protein [Desulfurococcales archaeon]
MIIVDDVLDEVFERTLKKSVFKNRRVLLPDYIPPTLLHRDEEIRRLGLVLAPSLKGEKPSNVFIYGLTGTGKTAVAKYVLDKLVKKAGELGVRTRYVYVNLRQRDTPYRVLADIAEALDLRIPFTGLSTGEVLGRIVKRLNLLEDTILIAVLDEIDFLVKKHGDDLLYKLVRMNSELKDSSISLVGITNNIYFIEHLDARIKSSLGEEELVFSPYKTDQLIDILKSRAEEAFIPGALENGVIELCASYAAKEHGDARRALDLLRIAGELADRLGEDKVVLEHVKMARVELEKNRLTEITRTLPLHGKLVLLSVIQSTLAGRRYGTTGEIYDIYKRTAIDIGLDPVTLRRVSDILSELDMLGLISARLISRGRYGKTRVVSLESDAKTIINVLSEEPFLGESSILDRIMKSLGI